MLNLKSIISRQQEDGTFTFAAVLLVDGKSEVELHVLPRHLLYYDEFCAHVLLSLGRPYRSQAAEGRPPSMSDYFHRLDVQAMLEQAPLKAASELN